MTGTPDLLKENLKTEQIKNKKMILISRPALRIYISFEEEWNNCFLIILFHNTYIFISSLIWLEIYVCVCVIVCVCVCVCVCERACVCMCVFEGVKEDLFLHIYKLHMYKSN